MDGKKIELPEIGKEIQLLMFYVSDIYFRVRGSPEHSILGGWGQALGAGLRPQGVQLHPQLL